MHGSLLMTALGAVLAMPMPYGSPSQSVQGFTKRPFMAVSTPNRIATYVTANKRARTQTVSPATAPLYVGMSRIDTQHLKAAHSGAVATIAQLLARGFRPSQPVVDDMTLLAVANPQLVDILTLFARHHLSPTGPVSNRALVVAVQTGDERTVDALMQLRAVPIDAAVDEAFKEAYSRAAFKIVEIMLNNGRRPSANCIDELTIHWRNDADKLNHLIRNGLVASSKTFLELGSLSCQEGAVGNLKFVWQLYPPDSRRFGSCLSQAASNGLAHVVRHIWPSRPAVTPIIHIDDAITIAIELKHFQVLSTLAEINAIPLSSFEYDTILEVAARYGQNELFEKVLGRSTPSQDSINNAIRLAYLGGYFFVGDGLTKYRLRPSQEGINDLLNILGRFDDERRLLAITDMLRHHWYPEVSAMKELLRQRPDTLAALPTMAFEGNQMAVNTVFSFSSAFGFASLMNMLANQGAKLDQIGITHAWFFAVLYQQRDSIQFLVQRGLRLDQFGANSLVTSFVFFGRPEVFTVLKDYQIEADEVTRRALISIALQNGHHEIAKMLQ